MFVNTCHSDYFTVLMINRFSHIFRITIIGILLAGFAAHLSLPFFGDAQKNAFTQWLNHNVVDTENESESELRERIRKLPENASDFWMLVQNASDLISEHEEDFRISPFTASQDDSNISTWLIGQWSSFKHHQSSTNAVLPELVQPIQKWITQYGSGTFYAVIKSNFSFDTPLLQALINNADVADTIFRPLVSGISINAP